MIRCDSRSTCRLCEVPLPARPVLDLGEQPAANNLAASLAMSLDAPRFPLRLLACDTCGLAQLSHSVDARYLFGDYLYVPSESASMRAHFDALAAQVAAWMPPTGLAIDVGSNDGYLLGRIAACRPGLSVLGIEPAGRLAVEARQRGVPTMEAYWNETVADIVLAKSGPVDVVTACNVFAHIDDPIGFARGAFKVLRPGGRFVVEVYALESLIRDGTFDTLYHEHVLTWHTDALRAALGNVGFVDVEIATVANHGGSHRAVAHKPEAPPPPVPLRGRPLPGLEALARQKTATIDQLSCAVSAAPPSGPVIGYGAAAKATVLIHAAGLGDRLEYIVDDNPRKVGRWIPGTPIRIEPSSTMRARPPAAAVIFPWNLAAELAARLPAGCQAIVPFPEVRILTGAAHTTL